MKRIVFDIETVGVAFETLDTAQQEYLLRYAETDEEAGKVRESLSFYPNTAEIVTIGMLDADTNRGAVYFQTPGDMLLPFEDDGVVYECGTEAEILQKFWKLIATGGQFVTFNGRTFDCPFLLIRSAVHRIKPTRDLMPNRYYATHIDLCDQLTFYGAVRRRFSLDMWCRTFGIKSSKEEGISGADVKDLFCTGRHIDIARYCARDLRATRELFLVWEQYLKTGDR
ncbi:MAG TPA: ribonuclease H-like domain-containing protein [Dissulfurispiraceae bacterium]|nr:ribonuclease H-like domain-containing protein [Dissulfurispiraceae bacterium]